MTPLRGYESWGNERRWHATLIEKRIFYHSDKVGVWSKSCSLQFGNFEQRWQLREDDESWGPQSSDGGLE